MTTQTSEDVLVKYLADEGIDVLGNGHDLSIAVFVDKNFHVFNDKILRKLVTLALAERDKNVEKGIATADLLGKWGEIIDAVKEVTLERRQMAEKNFIQATHIGRAGQPKDVISFLYTLFKTGYIDFLFLDVLDTTITALRSQPDSDESVAMYEFFKAVIEKARNESTPATDKAATATVSNSTKTTNIPTTNTNTTTTTTTTNTTSSTNSKVIEDSNIKNEKIVNNDKDNNNNNDNDDDDDDDDDDDIDSDDEIENHKKQIAEKEKQKRMDIIGVFINDLIKSIPNQSPDESKAKLLGECACGNMDPQLVLVVLSEYINACKAAGYENKMKLLEYWKTSVETEMKNNATPNVTRLSLLSFSLLSLSYHHYQAEPICLLLHIMHHNLLMLIIISRYRVKH